MKGMTTFAEVTNKVEELSRQLTTSSLVPPISYLMTLRR